MNTYKEILPTFVKLSQLKEMHIDEFSYCNKQLGEILSWSDDQLQALVEKAKEVIVYVRRIPHTNIYLFTTDTYLLLILTYYWYLLTTGTYLLLILTYY